MVVLGGSIILLLCYEEVEVYSLGVRQGWLRRSVKGCTFYPINNCRRLLEQA